MIRFASFVLALSALVLSGHARASYTLNLSGLNPTITSAGGTRFDFRIFATPQTSAGNLGQFFTVIDVANPSQSGVDSATFVLSENFTITGSGDTPGSLSGTLSGRFTFTGAASTFDGQFLGLTGSGFTVGPASYVPPATGSTLGSPTEGSIGFLVSPTTVPPGVPEPQSLALVVLGLTGLAWHRSRRSVRATS